ncbi:MAG: hypothetical protein HYV03_04715 [Deltaproteobacteria bacterium]|nr:hypothetical protein [Deltaproteobacteria bacterium]
MTDQKQTNTQTTRDKGSPELSAPPSLIRESLPTPSGGDETATDRQQPAPPVSDATHGDAKARERFVEATHQYVREYIRLADQKASFLFTGATALLAFLYKNDVSARWMKPIMQWNVLDTVAFVAMSSLALGVLLALWVVIPRTSGSRRGFLFWEAIAEYDTGRQYSDELRLLSAASLSQVKAEHCFDLARVCRTKYKILRAAIWTGAIGLAASLLVFLFI